MTNNFNIIDEQYEAGTQALRSYVVGFGLSVLLTIVPYLIVVNHLLERQNLMALVVGAAVSQLLVQVIFFLHLSKKSRPHWNLIVFIFTFLIVAILVVGSLWVMANLNYHAMELSPVNTNEGYIPR